MRTWVDAFDRVPVGYRPTTPPSPGAETGDMAEPAAPVRSALPQRVTFSVQLGTWVLWCGFTIRRRPAMKTALLTVTALLWLQPLAAQQSDPLATAPAGLARFRQSCTAEGGRLGGVSLCGPTYIVDPRTQALVATNA